MPECIVCKGHYQADRSCYDIEECRQEAETLRQEAKQARKTMERYRALRDWHRERLTGYQRKGPQRLKRYREKYKQRKQRYKEAEQERKKAQARREQTGRRYQTHSSAIGRSHKSIVVELFQAILLIIEWTIDSLREFYWEMVSLTNQGLRHLTIRRYRKTKQRYRKLESRHREAESEYLDAETDYETVAAEHKAAQQRYVDKKQACEEGEYRCWRCGSDNSVWEAWQASEPIEQEGLRGLFAFTEPHAHIPFLIIYFSLAFGLIGIWLWQDIKPPASLLLVIGTVLGCIIVLQGVYESRHGLRETEQLAEYRSDSRERAPRIELSAQLRTLVMPAVMLTLVLLLAYSLVQSEMLWKLLEWLIFEPQPTPTPEPTSSTEPEATPPTDTETQSDLESFKERVTRAFPLITMGMYAALSLGLVYSSSMMLARQYVNRMNGDLPKPIFRQDEKLAQVVRREAEIELGRQNPDDLHPSGKNVSRQRYVEFNGPFDPGHLLPGPEREDGPFPSLEFWAQDDTWTWDELERTEDGGVKMKVARQDIYRLPTPQESRHQPHPLVCYVVRANHWGRIKSIERVSDSENNVTG